MSNGSSALGWSLGSPHFDPTLRPSSTDTKPDCSSSVRRVFLQSSVLWCFVPFSELISLHNHVVCRFDEVSLQVPQPRDRADYQASNNSKRGRMRHLSAELTVKDRDAVLLEVVTDAVRKPLLLLTLARVLPNHTPADR